MILNVECGVILPGWTRQAEGWEDDFLAIARDEMKPILKQADQSIFGNMSIVEEARANVERLVTFFKVQECGISWG